MTNKVILKDGTTLIGLSNISVSEVDGTVFLNNTNRVEESVKGSFAIYYDDNQTSLIGAGHRCVWNKNSFTLEVENVESKSIDTTKLASDAIDVKTAHLGILRVDDYASSHKLSISKWLGFTSNNDTESQPFKLMIRENPKTKNESLVILSKYINLDKSATVLAVENDRIYLPGKLNIFKRTVESPIGVETDVEGDIAIDENFIYYCVENFNGVSNIWKRTPLQAW